MVDMVEAAGLAAVPHMGVRDPPVRTMSASHIVQQLSQNLGHKSTCFESALGDKTA